MRNDCKGCKVELTRENWYLSDMKRRTYLCKKCRGKYLKEWRRKNPEKVKVAIERYKKKYPKRVLEIAKRSELKLRMSAIEILGGHCSNCGCTLKQALEINHKFGGGRKEYKTLSPCQVYRGIVKGRLEKSRYNVLCRVCNALHYLKLKGLDGWNVTWKEISNGEG